MRYALIVILVLVSSACSTSELSPTVQQARSGKSSHDENECSYDLSNRVLTYVGRTGPEALDCFRRHRTEHVDTLQVTSPGGPVRSAIAAAAIIEEANWSVRAIGMCASSCMNYWVPASSSFSSENGTLLVVHGRPPWRLASLFSDDEYRQHQRFARRRQVPEEWFGERYSDRQGAISEEIGDSNAPNLLVGPCHARLLADVVPSQVWWPQSKADVQGLINASGLNLRVKGCELHGMAGR